MNTTEKELMKIVSRMTEDEWKKLRTDMRKDKKIMGVLEMIGRMKGWRK